MRTDDWYRLNRVSDVQFAPDAKSLAYVSARANRETQRHDAQIWLDRRRRSQRCAAAEHGFVSASQPRYSLDGARIAFLGRERAERAGADLRGRRQRRHGHTRHESRGWRRPALSGRRMGGVLRLSRVSSKREDRNDPLARRHRGKEPAFRAGRARLAQGPARARLRRGHRDWAAARSPTATSIMASPHGRPTAAGLAFTSDRTGNADNGGRNTDVFIVSAEGGTARKVSPHAEANGSPVFSPDGKSIAFTGVDRGGRPERHLCDARRRRRGGQPHRDLR